MTDDDQFLADLHAIAGRARASDPEGSAAPNSWQQVLATVNTTTETTTERRPSMHTHIAQPMSPVWEQSTPYGEQSRSFSGSFRRFTNLAATIALVLAVAVGGWLAMMQLQPGSPDPRFAVIGTPLAAQSQTCDVEPLSVDEAMSIAKNPFAHLEQDEEFQRESGHSSFEWIMDEEFSQPGYFPAGSMVTDVELEAVNVDEFSDASDVAQKFLDCIVYGTVGQVWRFVDPAIVQHDILSMLPMFTDEETARVLVNDLLSSPAQGRWGSSFSNPLQGSGTVRLNPNPELAASIHEPSGGSIHIVEAVLAPVIFLDGEGNVALETEISGFPLESNGLRLMYAQNLVMGRSVIDGHWYAIGFVPPNIYVVPDS